MRIQLTRGVETFVACVGNFIGNGIAALPEGVHSALGAWCGSFLPTVPILTAMFMKRPLDKRMRIVIGAATVAMLGTVYMLERSFNTQRESTISTEPIVVKQLEKIE